RVVVTRASGSVEFPASFTLMAASNPCPCGFDGDPRRSCGCPPHRVQAYRQRLSGPLRDRIDIVLTVPRLTRGELLGSTQAERAAAIRRGGEGGGELQRARLEGTPWTCNAQMSGPYARRHAAMSGDARTSLADAVEALGLSGRGFDRALKVARTLADLE